ncbi:MAG: alanine--glyoxylate aminotransferase family protein [Chloroflexi bacterium]|nr:alanine--glyoxylate aminotransferase family protein [Chloroflexota bacterium]
MNLRVPGPTPCPPEVLQASARQMINHRGPEFKALIASCTAGLKRFFQTQNDALILTGSGTGGMEAAVVNTLSPGEHILAVTIGVFGDRFASIAEAYGAKVTRLSFERGQPADPAAIRQALQKDPAITTVLVTHNETSTGVTNDLKAIAQVVRAADKLLVVDAISSLSSIDLPTDAWGCDVVISGSQKGWGVPPGLAFISMSARAWEANKKARMPRFYWDLARAKKSGDKGETPWTPAVSVMFALETALQLMEREGMAQVFARHERVARRCREGVKALGLELFARESYASTTVTAIKVPPGVDGKQVSQAMRQDSGVVISGGQQDLEGKIWRIGHLGHVSEPDVDDALRALEQALVKAGFPAKKVAAGR